MLPSPVWASTSAERSSGNLNAVSRLMFFDPYAVAADVPAFGVNRNAHLLAVPNHELHGAITGVQAQLGFRRDRIVLLPFVRASSTTGDDKNQESGCKQKG